MIRTWCTARGGIRPIRRTPSIRPALSSGVTSCFSVRACFSEPPGGTPGEDLTGITTSVLSMSTGTSGSTGILTAGATPSDLQRDPMAAAAGGMTRPTEKGSFTGICRLARGSDKGKGPVREHGRSSAGACRTVGRGRRGASIDPPWSGRGVRPVAPVRPPAGFGISPAEACRGAAGPPSRRRCDRLPRRPDLLPGLSLRQWSRNGRALSSTGWNEAGARQGRAGNEAVRAVSACPYPVRPSHPGAGE